MLTVDDLTFSVRRSSRRRSLQITVDRDGSLTIAAPEHCPTEALESFVRDKKLWIYSKLIEKEQRLRPPPVKEFVTGEGFPYLGKSYRLLLVDAQPTPIKLEHGRFKLRRDLAPEGRAHLIRWYSDHARAWLRDRVDRFAGRIGVTPRAIDIRDLGHRWGSCSPSSRLNFHWRVILAPPPVAEYVVVHELVHLIEPHHGPPFWSHVGRILPSWPSTKAWLDSNGSSLLFDL